MAPRRKSKPTSSTPLRRSTRIIAKKQLPKTDLSACLSNFDVSDQLNKAFLSSSIDQDQSLTTQPLPKNIEELKIIQQLKAVEVDLLAELNTLQESFQNERRQNDAMNNSIIERISRLQARMPMFKQQARRYQNINNNMTKVINSMKQRINDENEAETTRMTLDQLLIQRDIIIENSEE